MVFARYSFKKPKFTVSENQYGFMLHLSRMNAKGGFKSFLSEFQVYFEAKTDKKIKREIF